MRSLRRLHSAMGAGSGAARFFLACLALLIVITAAAARSEPTLSATNVRAGLPVEPLLEELDDITGRLEIQDVTHEPLASRFRLPTAGRGRSGEARCRWYRFRLDPALELAGPFVLLAGRGLESATLFEPDRFGFHAESFGTDTPVRARRLQDGFAGIDVPHADYGALLYVRETGPAVARLTLATRSSLDAAERTSDLRGVFFGTVYAVLAIAALIFALVTRAPAFSYYAMYMTAQAFSKFVSTPFGRRELWPDIAVSPLAVNLIYYPVTSLSLNWFFRFALGTRKSPLFDRILQLNGWIGAGLGVVCSLVDSYYGTSYIGSVLATFWAAALAATAVIAFIRWRQRYVSAGIYLIGLAGVAVGLALYVWVHELTADIGIVWEALAFLAAIAYRLVVVTRDREAALAETVAANAAVARENALRTETVEAFNAAFARFVPRAFLEQLGRRDVRDVALGDHVESEMNVLFCDIRSFVALSETLKPEATFKFLNAYFGRVGPIIRANNGFIDQYLGDGVKALFAGSSDDAVRAAIGIHGEVRRLNELRAREGAQPIEIGVALHRGPVILATIGESERYDTTVITEVVNVAARLEGLTKVYGARIIASAAVIGKLVEPQAYNVRPLGELQLLGSAKPIWAFEVCDGDAADVLLFKRATAETFATGIAAYRRGDFRAAAGIFGQLARDEPADRVAAFFAERSRRRGEVGTIAWDGVERHETKG